ncbi:MAG TPA: TIGR03618 family F420-dependent PPOX class oxidoreductase [Gaiellaceae bacterium]
MSELEPQVAELFGGGHVVHLTTLRPDGAPQSRPVWTIVDDGNVVFFTQPSSPKARDLAADPRVALSVADRANSYRSAWLRGHVVRTVEGDAALAIIDRISEAYIGKAFPMRSGTVYVVEAEAQGSATLPFDDPR